MSSTQERLNHALRQGYQLDFSTVFEKAFENYKKIALQAGFVVLILLVVIVTLITAVVSGIVGVNNFSETMLQVNLSTPFPILMAQVVAIAALGGFISPISAGLIRMAHLAENRKDFSISTAFYYYKEKYFKELFLATFLLGLVGGLVSVFPYIGSMISYVISFFTFLTIPLIIFADLKAVDAINKSILLVSKQPIVLLGLLLVMLLAVLIGLVALCIGIAFTIPFMYSMYYTIYSHIIPLDSEDEIDQIGTSMED